LSNVNPRFAWVFLVFAVAPMLAAPAAAQDDELASQKLRVDWQTFKKHYDAKEIVVVDVRDTTSYEIGHIPGARSIPLPDIEREINNLKKITKPIVVYCA
jgi:3-mercaptopyruvate sulfurtransferase SseA